MAQREDRTAHWGACSDHDCLTSMIIYPSTWAKRDLPPKDEWENSPFFISCPVCGESMDWGGEDHPADLIKGY